MAGFTPGPWICQSTDREGPDFGVAIIAVDLHESGEPVSSPTRGLVGAALPWPTEIDGGDMSRAEANARLIAAAPELYEALVHVRAIIAEGAAEGFRPLVGDWAERLFDSQRKTSAAIARATGQ